MINLKTHVTLLKIIIFQSSPWTSAFRPHRFALAWIVPHLIQRLTILRQILIFILCELSMFASDFHQIKTSIIKSVRPSFISSYEWKSQKSKCTLFSVLKILALHLYAKLTSDESKFLWKQVMPQVAKQLRITQKIYKDKPVVDIIPISDSVHVKTLVPAPIQWQVQHTGWRKEEGRIGQKRPRVH